ncbi:MAG: DUF3082 domain-containing protein, partial [Pseudanabaenaceae cyanobacterium bins.68]|nr:DUF3082 domain-containing protein [Pseudanabaenaceae cyanobacterium bins.68]
MPEPFTPLKNLTGAAIAGSLAIILYGFSLTVAAKLANPISSHNSLALRLSLLVRQVLLTLATAAALIFGAIALGLILFTLQQG